MGTKSEDLREDGRDVAMMEIRDEGFVCSRDLVSIAQRADTCNRGVCYDWAVACSDRDKCGI